jgi:Enoyl-(Acyl carrier protein) reductase
VASKHAVEGLTKAAALEGAEFGVRVNAVAPGPVETEMLNRVTGSADRKAGLIAGVPLKRAGTPDEIAQTIVFLTSDRASFITGQIVTAANRRHKSYYTLHALGEGGAFILDEAALAGAGPVAVQDQPIFLVREVVGESFTARIDLDILLSPVAEVLLAKAPVGLGVSRSLALAR